MKKFNNFINELSTDTYVSAAQGFDRKGETDVADDLFGHAADMATKAPDECPNCNGPISVEEYGETGHCDECSEEDSGSGSGSGSGLKSFESFTGTYDQERDLAELDLQQEFDDVEDEILDPDEFGEGVGAEITCQQCGWQWDEDAANPEDSNICHQCGHDTEVGHMDDESADYGVDMDELYTESLKRFDDFVNENEGGGGGVAAASAASTSGMGNVSSAQPATGQAGAAVTGDGTEGSGDYGNVGAGTAKKRRKKKAKTAVAEKKPAKSTGNRISRRKNASTKSLTMSQDSVLSYSAFEAN